MNKAIIVQAIVEALRAEFESLRNSSRQTRSAGNDAETKAEGKYDTRSIEENYLADGLARQAREAEQAAVACQNMPLRDYENDEPIDLGALVRLEFPDAAEWFFLAPAGGGLEVHCEGKSITVLTPESPLGGQLIGLTTGKNTKSPKAVVRQIA